MSDRICISESLASEMLAWWDSYPPEVQAEIIRKKFVPGVSASQVRAWIQERGEDAVYIAHAYMHGLPEYADAIQVRLAQERLASALEAARTLDAERRKKELEGAREAGQAKRKAPAAEVLEREVRELHERAPYLSWSEVCTKVGRKYNISRQTVTRHAAAADWRSEPQ